MGRSTASATATLVVVELVPREAPRQRRGATMEGRRRPAPESHDGSTGRCPVVMQPSRHGQEPAPPRRPRPVSTRSFSRVAQGLGPPPVVPRRRYRGCPRRSCGGPGYRETLVATLSSSFMGVRMGTMMPASCRLLPRSFSSSVAPARLVRLQDLLIDPPGVSSVTGRRLFTRRRVTCIRTVPAIPGLPSAH